MANNEEMREREQVEFEEHGEGNAGRIERSDIVVPSRVKSAVIAHIILCSLVDEHTDHIFSHWQRGRQV